MAPQLGIERGGIQVIDRAASLLALLAAAGEGGVTLSSLVAQSGLNTATCHRILASLRQHGLAAREVGDKRYRLGLGFFTLGSQAAEGPGLRALCRPVLTRLCAETGDTVFLMARHGFHSVCIDRRDGTTLIQTLTGGIGGKAPLGVGPGSQAILAFIEAAEAEAILRHNARDLEGFQNHSFRAVEETLRETRQRGYAQDLGGIIAGISGIAVPIRPPGCRDAVGSLGLGMLSSRLDGHRLGQLAALLRREAEALEARINPLAPWLS